MGYQIIRLIDKSEMIERSAHWFHEKWDIPFVAYLESMKDSLRKKIQFHSGMW